LNWINQYIKKRALIIRKRGKTKVRTDKNGNKFGAKNGNT
jgi:hypothetical protein